MAEPSRPARLWYRASSTRSSRRPTSSGCKALLDLVCAPGIKFEVHGLDPPDHLFHPLTEFRCAAQNDPQCARGRDARDTMPSSSAISRSPVSLDIRGASTSLSWAWARPTMLAALSRGRRLGLVTIDPCFIDWHERQVRAHGHELARGGRAGDPRGPAGVHARLHRRGQFTRRSAADFVEEVRPLVAAGGGGHHPGRRAADAAVRARAPLRHRRRAGAQRHRGGGQGGGDGARAAFASPERWSAAAAPTPRPRRNASRSISAGAGEDIRARTAGIRAFTASAREDGRLRPYVFDALCGERSEVAAGFRRPR